MKMIELMKVEFLYILLFDENDIEVDSNDLRNEIIGLSWFMILKMLEVVARYMPPCCKIALF